MSTSNKIVVFDLDETLGYFTQLCLIWESICCCVKDKNITIEMQQEIFNKLLDLFPEYIRPKIESILEYLKIKKASKKCKSVMIYTNNQRQKSWVNLIKTYFEKKVNFDLFDQIICAFKINGKTVEICRTTHNKTHKDFIQCTKIPETAEICFIDDTFYPDMASDNVFYINIKPYYYDLPIDYMINKFIESEVGKKIINGDTDFETKIMKQIKLYKYECIDKDLKEYEVDKILGKHIITHLQEFFKPKRNKSLRKKTKSNSKNRTKRNN